ncbi:hypothetical protein HPB49_016383 [Dermacentor silvarum]|uniref:Uncharacterized protein n=1 Tax=Dermacentor silvarum TaxID=543639 RepID=A0ACB8C4F6_DERSI|nr:hypothetical protein HPB49_016383 [Dermacentor silvarum]
MCKWKEGEEAAPAELLEIECHKMVKKLKKMMEEGEGRGGHVKPCPKVDIGGGVIVDEAIIHGLRRNCAGAPAKFARGLMRHLFTAEELRGKSLFGRKSNAHPSAPQREALDPAKVNAIIGFTVAEYQADPMRLKSSLSSLLSRELK